MEETSLSFFANVSFRISLTMLWCSSRRGAKPELPTHSDSHKPYEKSQPSYPRDWETCPTIILQFKKKTKYELNGTSTGIRKENLWDGSNKILRRQTPSVQETSKLFGTCTRTCPFLTMLEENLALDSFNLSCFFWIKISDLSDSVDVDNAEDVNPLLMYMAIQPKISSNILHLWWVADYHE